MFPSRRLPLAALLEFCHILRVNLSAGLRLQDVFRQLATRGSRKVRPLAGRILKRLEQGKDFRAALEPEKDVFPPFFLGMADVGEQTGHLPEVLEELDRYYFQQQKYRRELRKRSTMPAVQFILAIGVVALLIFILGVIAESRGTASPAVMGFRGALGAIQFLLCAAALIAGLYVVFLVFTRTLQQQAAVDGLLLRLPVIGPCVEALVVGRFALAMMLTLDSSLPLVHALELSFQAAGNAAFARQEEAVVAAVEEGDDLTIALSRSGHLPADFLAMVAVAEESGKLVDMMRRQAAHYHEEARRRLQSATRLASGLIQFLYVVLMVLMILRIGSSVVGNVGG